MAKKRRSHRINDEIRFPQVRIVGDGIDSEIMSSREAVDYAYSLDKDLILINEGANPPVVKIEEYSRFIYQQEKQEKERRRNASKVELKEIQLSTTIADNDLNTKSKKAIELLQDNNKVKCVILLKGRQKARPEQGELVMLKFANIVSANGTPEALPKLDGSRWIMILKPKTTK